MRISCPNCRSVYQLAQGSLGATGRKVRCTRCGLVWHAKPGAPPPPVEEEVEAAWTATAATAAVDEPSLDEWRSALTGDEEAEKPRPHVGEKHSDADFRPRPHRGRLTEEEIGGDAAPEEAEAAAEPAAPDAEGVEEPVSEPAAEPKPEPAAAGPTIDAPSPAFEARKGEARKKRPRPRPSAGRRLGAKIASSLVISLAALTMIVTVGGALFARSVVVHAFPDLAGLYALVGLDVNLRGLDIEGVETVREMDDGAPVLVVKGEIVNVTAGPRPVPTIRFGLRTSTGREVYAWTMEPQKRTLGPGERSAFHSRLPAPPEAASEVQVRFTDRRAP